MIFSNIVRYRSGVALGARSVNRRADGAKATGAKEWLLFKIAKNGCVVIKDTESVREQDHRNTVEISFVKTAD